MLYELEKFFTANSMHEDSSWAHDRLKKVKPWPKIPKNSQISLIFSAPESTLSIPLLIDIYSVLLFVGR